MFKAQWRKVDSGEKWFDLELAGFKTHEEGIDYLKREYSFHDIRMLASTEDGHVIYVSHPKLGSSIRFEFRIIEKVTSPWFVGL